MDENVIRLLLKEHSDAFTSRLIAIQTELEATKNLVHARHGGGGDQGSMIPRAMRLDVPKFTGTYPNRSIRGASYGTERDRIVDHFSDARSRAGPAESSDSCRGKIEAVKNWKAPTTLFEIRSFLWLAGYSRRVCAVGVEQDEDFQNFINFIVMRRYVHLPMEHVKKSDTRRLYNPQSESWGAVVFALKFGDFICTVRKGFVIYQGYKSLQHIFDQKELNIRQKRRIELFSDYECEIRYHPGKANVVANALSRKERVKPKRVRAMAMTIQSRVKGMILAAQGEAFNRRTYFVKGYMALDQQLER
ncbi:hypothetical protein Tco_0974102 [Tanacetum coccineum]|uniref:Reverse transcriptase domain-containing protein n=1 Tax=Tanacetum coccineum TaxID=301880 RepID=A0ABQ5EAM4_9ASTR